MDATLLPLLQTFYRQWIQLGQDGTLTISNHGIRWTSEDLTLSADLSNAIVASSRTRLRQLIRATYAHGNNDRLRAYYALGEYLELQSDDIRRDVKRFTVKAAIRVYTFFTFHGLDSIGRIQNITATRLGRLSQHQFDDLMYDVSSTLAGARSQEGDTLSPESQTDPQY